MAFDETLAGRIRKRLGKRKGLTEKQMFGGIAFLVNGNMCCGVHRDEMIVRLPPDETEQALESPEYRSKFSNQELELLKGVLKLPLAPVRAENQQPPPPSAQPQ